MILPFICASDEYVWFDLIFSDLFDFYGSLLLISE